VNPLRRTLLLAGLAGLGALLVAVVRAPERPAGRDAVRGHRIFAVAPGAVRAVEVTLDARHFSARRAGERWEIDGRPASAGTADALTDLVDTLAGLRAVDVFRGGDASEYGLDRPRATIDLVTARGRRRVVFGEMTASGSSYYARRVGDPRILQVGVLVLTDVERVFYTRDGGSSAG
jgi:uncharacterized protein DUF4340